MENLVGETHSIFPAFETYQSFYVALQSFHPGKDKLVAVDQAADQLLFLLSRMVVVVTLTAAASWTSG